MQHIISTLFGITLIVIAINADPFLFLPRHMLPPIGIVYTMAFNATSGTSHLGGHYVLHALTSLDNKTIIGYRVWQLYSDENNRNGYEEYYINGTIFQSIVNPVTQECVPVFSRRVECTDWLNTEIIRWDNRCSLYGGEISVDTTTKMIVFADTSDLKRPIKMSVSLRMDNSPEEIQLTFQFASKTVGNTFPNLKCAY